MGKRLSVCLLAGISLGVASLCGQVLGGGYVADIAASPNGEYVAVARPTQVELWDPRLQHRLQSFPGAARAVEWSPDSSKLVIEGYTTWVWDVRAPALLSQWHVDHSTVSVSWAPTNDHLVQLSRWGAEIYDAAGKSVRTIPQTRLFQVAWSPTANYVAMLVDSGADIFDVTSGKKIRSINVSGAIREAYQNRWDGLAWSPREPLLATCDLSNTVQVWNVETGAMLASAPGGGSWHSKLAWSRDGEKIALATHQSLILWDAHSLRQLREIPAGVHIAAATFSSGLDRAIAASGAGEFEIWDLAAGASERVSSQNAEWDYLAWSPRDSLLASWGSNNTVQVWEPAKQVLRAKFQAAVWGAQSVSWSDDGRFVAAGADDGTVMLHDALTGDLTSTLRGARPPVFAISHSPDGKRLAALAGGSLWIWNLSDASPQRRWPLAGRRLVWTSAEKVLVVTMENALVELDVDTGTRTWTERVDAPAGQNASYVWVSTDGRFYMLGANPTLWQRDGAGPPGPADKQPAGGPLFSCTPDPGYACRTGPGGYVFRELSTGQEWPFGRQVPARMAAVSPDRRSVALGFSGIILITTLPVRGR